MAKKSLSVNKAVEGKVSKTKMTGRSASAQKTVKIPQLNIADSIARVRDLAWTGQHAQAIELASQTLVYSKIKPTEQMDLLDLRAESYIAQGALALAAKDAAAMVKLANAGKKPVFKAQALNRKALVQMRMGDLKAAVKSATNALKASQQAKQKPLIAQSLFRLSEAQFRTQQSQAAVETAEKAIVLFKELGDASGAGRAYLSKASAYFVLRQAEDSRRAGQTALELCQQAGDHYGAGKALNAIYLTDVDIAESIQRLQQSRQAFETAGYAEGQAGVVNNLGNTYCELGLYPHGRRLHSEGVEITRSMGAKLGLAYALTNLIEAEIILGAFEAAHV